MWGRSYKWHTLLMLELLNPPQNNSRQNGLPLYFARVIPPHPPLAQSLSMLFHAWALKPVMSKFSAELPEGWAVCSCQLLRQELPFFFRITFCLEAVDWSLNLVNQLHLLHLQTLTIWSIHTNNIEHETSHCRESSMRWLFARIRLWCLRCDV